MKELAFLLKQKYPWPQGISNTYIPKRVSLVSQMVKNLPAMQETQAQSLGRKDPLEKEMAPTPVFLPGEFL